MNNKKFYLFIKRTIDIIVPIIGLIILSPLILFVSILIKIDSTGPVFIKQKRIGKDNKIFIMYKFRTMKIGTPEVAKEILLKQGFDLYLTRIGKILRRTFIDEIPQLINVLMGKMSLVGPRPALYNQYDLIELRKNLGIHKIKPGITGWAIISGGEDLTLEEKVKCDLFYLNNMSLIFDIKIIIKTIMLFFKPKGVY